MNAIPATAAIFAIWQTAVISGLHVHINVTIKKHIMCSLTYKRNVIKWIVAMIEEEWNTSECIVLRK